MPKYTKAEMYQMFESVVKPTDINTAKYQIEFINDQLRYGAFSQKPKTKIKVIAPTRDWDELQTILSVYRLAGWYVLEVDVTGGFGSKYDLIFSYTKEQHEKRSTTRYSF